VSEALEARAELLKVARMLRRDPAELDRLRDLPAADLREIREAVTEVLFDADADRFAPLVTLSRVVPPPVVATATQKAVGPLLTARIAGIVDTDHAIEVARRLPIGFLADVAVEIDPRRAEGVIGAMPPETVVEVSEELAAREEHVAMGRFVSHLDDATIAETFGVIDDDALLRIAFTLEDKRGLAGVVALLPDERLAGVLAAAGDEDLWAEALDLVDHLDEDGRARVAALAADLDDDALLSLVEAAEREDLWALLAQLLRAAGDDARAALAERARRRGIADRLAPVAGDLGL
jgi:hypothetical protein